MAPFTVFNNYSIMVFIMKIKLLFLMSLLVFFFSCSARIDGVVKEGGAADLTIKTSLEPRTIALIRSIRGFMGEAADTPVPDGPAISRSMAAAPGIRSVSLSNTGPAALEGTIAISNVGDFLSTGDDKSRFVTFTEGRGGGTSSVVISLDRTSAPEVISQLSPEVEEYLLALLAPVVLGETSSKRDYLDLISLIYGRALADEISGARIHVFIEFPRPVISVSGGTSSGRTAEFNVPLVDVLVMEKALRYEVVW